MNTSALNLYALAVPLFLFFMALEYGIARRRGKPYFSFAHSVANLNVGIAERLLDVFITGSLYYYYDFLYRHFAIWEFKPGLLWWILLLLCTDFMWYWYHRLGHEVNLFWSVHVVHHQSPDFNYTASVRITVFQAIARTGFWSVLPILGFPAHMITSILLLHGIYPFFTHTRLIGKLGFLEYILVTPSHHRVHHASNPMYLDKNYGDMFIFWDKLFGTFQEETEEPVYGLVHPLYSHSFLWQHFHFLFEMFYTAKRAQGFRNKMRVVFGPPTLIDPNIRSVLERKWHILPGEGSTGKVLRWYTGVQLGAALAVLFVFLLFERRLIWPIEVSISLFLLLTLINCGAILEQKRWVFYLEWMRVLVLIPGLVLFLPLPWVLCLLLALGGVLLLFQERLKERYLAYIFEK